MAEEPGQPTISSHADPAYTYPRVVVCDPGIPEGWKAVESVMGPNSKIPGSVYLRYSSLDGRHKHLSSVKALITKHCEDTNSDPEPLLAEYQRLQRDPPEGSRMWLKQQKIEREKEETRRKAEEKAAFREAAIARFEEKFGALYGAVVFGFPGWTTTWDYLPKSGQIQTRYIDPDGGDWWILKDLEVALQKMVDNGEPGPGGVDVGDLIAAGRKNADQEAFALGAVEARQTGGRVQKTQGGEVKSMSREEAEAIIEAKRDAKREAKREEERQAKKMRKSCYASVSPHPRGPVQEDWATLRNLEDMQVAFTTFRKLLEARGFSETVELVAVNGASQERRYARRIVGVYAQMETLVEERRCYQKLLHAPQLTSAVCCDSIYIVWKSSASRWQIVTKPGADDYCLAFCEDDQEHLANVKMAWRVQDGFNDFKEDSKISISTLDTLSSAPDAE